MMCRAKPSHNSSRAAHSRAIHGVVRCRNRCSISTAQISSDCKSQTSQTRNYAPFWKQSDHPHVHRIKSNSLHIRAIFVGRVWNFSALVKKKMLKIVEVLDEIEHGIVTIELGHLTRVDAAHALHGCRFRNIAERRQAKPHVHV